MKGSETPSDTVEGPQEWRRDRIRAGVARTYVLLGQDQKATAAAEGAVESEVGPIQVEQARRVDSISFEARMDALDSIVAPGDFDPLRAALDTYVELFHRYYDEPARRTQIEKKIEAAWAKLPIQVRLEVQMDLVEHALDRDDAPNALALVHKAQAMIDATRWTVESHVPLCAKIAGLRFRAGDGEKARADADAALLAYENARGAMVNIDRAAALRPLAEVYHAMGDSAKARIVYAKVVEEGVVNPNSRPRADDLSATATSMALHAVEPDAALLARMREIGAKLGDPW